MPIRPGEVRTNGSTPRPSRERIVRSERRRASPASFTVMRPSSPTYHGGLYFQHDFGKSRNLALTRVLYQDGSSHVAVVRGDGRRNTYRWNGSSFDAAAGVRNSLTSSGGVFEETTPSGRIYRYDSNGRLQRVVDRIGNPAYFRCS